MPTSITEANGQTTYRAGSNAVQGALHRVRGAVPTLQFTANGAASAVAWSDGGVGGTFAAYGANNANAAYTPANKTQNVTISATDSGGTVTYALTVFGTIPVRPQVGYECEIDVETKIKKARDGTRYAREDGVPEAAWVFAWDNRQLDASDEMWQFWLNHRRTQPFYLVDTEGNLLNRVFFNSSLKRAPNGSNRWAMSASFAGVYQGIQPDAGALLHLMINAGNTVAAVGAWQPDAYYLNGTAFSDFSTTPDVRYVTQPLPNQVYQYTRFHATQLNYKFTGLRAGWTYLVKLHFFGYSGPRTIGVHVAGGAYPNVVLADAIVQVREYSVVADVNDGSIAITLDNLGGTNVLVSALEVIEQ